MDVYEWLQNVAYKKLCTLDDPMNCSFEDDRREYEVWLSKFDDSYITQVGMEENVKFLADREITEELTHGVGFSPKDQKWYGWSHRAIHGFGVGSTCLRGHCHYVPVDKDDFLKDMIEFWKDDYNENVRGEHTKDHDLQGVQVYWDYPDKVQNKELHGEICGCFHPYPDTWGKGEWTARTLADAKQMAIDFNEGVS